MRTHCIAQGTLLGALWCPKQEENPGKGDKCTTESLHCIAETNTTL